MAYFDFQGLDLTTSDGLSEPSAFIAGGTYAIFPRFEVNGLTSSIISGTLDFTMVGNGLSIYLGEFLFTSLDFVRPSIFANPPYNNVPFNVGILLEMPDNLPNADYRIEIDAELFGSRSGDVPGSFTSDPIMIGVGEIDLSVTSTTIAEPVVEGDGSAWFALTIQNDSTLPQLADYEVGASIRTVTSQGEYQAFDLFSLANVAPGSNGRRIVQLKLDELDAKPGPGTYEVRFSVFSQDSGESDVNIFNNVGAALVYIKPENPSEMARANMDFDGDRVEDVLFFNEDTRGVGQFGMPTGEWSSLGRAGSGWVAKGTGHFDSDDDFADILWFNENTRNVGRFDLSESGSSWGGLGKAGVGWEVAGAGDFNGDGTDDILWLNTITNVVGQFRVTDGTPAWQGVGRAGSVWELSDIGDFNGDGVDDLLWYNTQSGALGQFVMSESGMSWAQITTLGQGYRVVGVGDFDADGTQDILVFNDNTRKVGAFFMDDGQATWDGSANDALADGWTIEGVGDFDGNGLDELMIRNTDGTVSRIIYEDGNYATVRVGVAGTDWDVML